MRRIKGLVAVLLAVCTVFSVTGCDTVERIKERISQETVDEETQDLLEELEEV